MFPRIFFFVLVCCLFLFSLYERTVVLEVSMELLELSSELENVTIALEREKSERRKLEGLKATSSHRKIIKSLESFEDLFEVYFINLDSREDRRKHMEESLKKLEIPFERITAVNGKHIYNDSFVKNFFSYRKNKKEDIFFPIMKEPTDEGKKAVILSMMKSLDNFLSNSEKPYLLLLEDDAEFIVQNPKKKLLEFASTGKLKELNFLDLRAQKAHCCLAGVVYKREAVKTILTQMNPLNSYFKFFGQMTDNYENKKEGRRGLADYMLTWMCDFHMVSCWRTPLVRPFAELSCKSNINPDGKGDGCKEESV